MGYRVFLTILCLRNPFEDFLFTLQICWPVSNYSYLTWNVWHKYSIWPFTIRPFILRSLTFFHFHIFISSSSICKIFIVSWSLSILPIQFRPRQLRFFQVNNFPWVTFFYTHNSLYLFKYSLHRYLLIPSHQYMLKLSSNLTGIQPCKMSWRHWSLTKHGYWLTCLLAKDLLTANMSIWLNTMQIVALKDSKQD